MSRVNELMVLLLV